MVVGERTWGGRNVDEEYWSRIEVEALRMGGGGEEELIFSIFALWMGTEMR